MPPPPPPVAGPDGAGGGAGHQSGAAPTGTANTNAKQAARPEASRCWVFMGLAPERGSCSAGPERPAGELLGEVAGHVPRARAGAGAGVLLREFLVLLDLLGGRQT